MVDKIVVNNGVKIHYSVKKGGKKTLIFLHGGGGSSSGWSFLLPYFREKYTLITIDLRGHGYSDRPELIADYEIHNHVDDIAEVLKKEKINRVILIGHCFGSMVGISFTVQYPEAIERLILINAGFTMPQYTLSPIMKRLLIFSSYVVSYCIQPPKSGGIVEYTPFVGSRDISLRRLNADMRIMGWGAGARQLLATISWDGRELLRMIQCPTLIIGGLHDLLYPPNYTKKLSEYIDKSLLRYVDSNHISIINNPKAVYDTMVEFLGI